MATRIFHVHMPRTLATLRMPDRLTDVGRLTR